LTIQGGNSTISNLTVQFFFRGSGIAIGGTTGDNHVFNDVLFTNGTGVSITENNDNLVSNSDFLFNGTGVSINGKVDDEATGNTLMNNTIRDNTGVGVYIGAAATGNTIGLINATVKPTFEGGNDIYGNGGDGIRIAGNKNVLQNNTIGLAANGAVDGNGQNGIMITGSGNTIGGAGNPSSGM
jgi:parallel beta-helix repeat protein